MYLAQLAVPILI